MSVITEELGYKAPFQQVKRKFFSLGFPNKAKTGKGGLVFPYTLLPTIALRADQGISKSDRVDSWTSGDLNSRSFGALTTDRPNTEANVFGTLTGVKSSSGTQGLMSYNGIPLTANGLTVFCLYRLDDASEYGVLYGNPESDNEVVFEHHATSSSFGSFIQCLTTTNAYLEDILGTSDGEKHIIEVIYDPAIPEHKVFRDAREIISDLTPTDVGDLNSSERWGVPGQPQTGSSVPADGVLYPLEVTIGAFFMWNSALSATNRIDVRHWIDDLSDNTILPTNLITGTNSTMNGPNDWINDNLDVLDINTTVPGKMYMLGNTGSNVCHLEDIIADTVTYKVHLKARLNTGPSTICNIGDAVGSFFSFTPTATEQTFEGEFTSTTSDPDLYLGSTGGSDGVAWEIDDIYVGTIP